MKRVREAQRLPYTELSERLGKLGRPIPVLGLRRIERGERRVDVDDLAALARALNVPPISLLFPLGGEETVDILPGESYHPWTAMRWFIGEDFKRPGLPTETVENRDEELYERAALPILRYRKLAKWDGEWVRIMGEIIMFRRRAAEARTGAELDKLTELTAEALRRLSEVEGAIFDARQEMRERGIAPPPLPPAMSKLDDRIVRERRDLFRREHDQPEADD